ncbi:MAG: DUF3047 domain-containing protein [Candidatus Wallbacteria bacterium]|nr:DUF3047 domain-containing protein [Candidatus Wallbacteria bacterium]
MNRISMKSTILAAAACLAFGAADAQPNLDGLEVANAPKATRALKGTDLIGFGNAADFAGFFKNGWESERDDPKNWTLERPAAGFLFLRMPSKDDSVQIGHKVGPFAVASNPMLRVKFRVDQVPPGADISTAKREDTAFRFFVVFDKKDGWIAPNTIGYAWTTSNEVGAFIRSDRTGLKNVWYVVIGKGQGTNGQWQTFERDVEADYRRAFRINGEVPRIVAIGIKGDTNDTHTQSLAGVAEATLGPR